MASRGVSNLSVFLEELHAKVGDAQFSDLEQRDIADAVKDMVTNILSLLPSVDPMLEVKETHTVGSFYEGTKIGSPNEFDFVAEMQFLKPDMVNIRNECGNPGVVHIILKNPHDLPDERQVVKTTTGEPIHYLSPVAMRNQFWKCFILVAKFLVSEGQCICRETGTLKLYSDIPEFLDLIGSGPNIELAMCWASKDSDFKLGISVDVTPCISLPIPIPENCEVARELLDDSALQCVKLIPTINHECKNATVGNIDEKLCWRLSFSTLETKLVQQMDPTHKRCLRILKYIKTKHDGDPIEELGMGHLLKDVMNSVTVKLYHNLADMHLLSTYMLKMAVLQHESTCPHPDKDVGSCMMTILQYILDCMEKQFLPSLFIPGKNAWSRLSKKPGPGPSILTSHVTDLQRLFQKIIDSKSYNFEEFYSEFSKVQHELVQHDGM